MYSEEEFGGFLFLQGDGGHQMPRPLFGNDGESALTVSPKADGESESARRGFLFERRPCPQKPLFFPAALFLRGWGEAGGVTLA